MNLVCMDRSDSVPARAGDDLGNTDGFATPRCHDDLGVATAYFVGRDDAFGGCAFGSQVSENIDRSGALYRFSHPANAGDQRIVPFLEIKAWRRFCGLDRCESLPELAQLLLSLRLAVNDAPEEGEGGFDFGKGPLVCA